ncbi:unnamed protein product [Prunus armeniaca]
MIESRMIVHEGERGEPSVDSREAEYREMQRNYRVLEAVAYRVLALSHTLEVGVPLLMRNILTEVKLAELRTDFSVPPLVGLRLPFHPWVQMMLAKLSQHLSSLCIFIRSPSNMEVLAGYMLIAERQTREVTLLVISLLLRSLGGTGLVKWGSISKEQEDEVERVRSLLSETERDYRNLVTQKNLFESGLLQGMASVINGSTKVAVDLDEAEMQRRLRESRAKKAEKGGARQATRKRLRDDDEGLVADVLGEEGGRMRWRKLTRVFGEMYVNMAKADKEIQRLKRRNEMTKDKISGAHEAIREKNALLL